MDIGRTLVVAFAAVVMVQPVAAQERTAVRAGFELSADRGKTILVFRPTVRVGAQSTGGMFEPNGDWTDEGRRNIETALATRQQTLGDRVVAAPDAIGADA
jgi:hypothetical protein